MHGVTAGPRGGQVCGGVGEREGGGGARRRASGAWSAVPCGLDGRGVLRGWVCGCVLPRSLSQRVCARNRHAGWGLGLVHHPHTSTPTHTYPSRPPHSSHVHGPGKEAFALLRSLFSPLLSPTPRHRHIRLEASGDYPLNLSISLSGGKEINRDLLSSGERTGASPALNRGSAHAGREMWGEGLPAHPRGTGRAPHVQEASARRPRTPHQRG